MSGKRNIKSRLGWDKGQGNDARGKIEAIRGQQFKPNKTKNVVFDARQKIRGQVAGNARGRLSMEKPLAEPSRILDARDKIESKKLATSIAKGRLRGMQITASGNPTFNSMRSGLRQGRDPRLGLETRSMSSFRISVPLTSRDPRPFTSRDSRPFPTAHMDLMEMETDPAPVTLTRTVANPTAFSDISMRRQVPSSSQHFPVQRRQATYEPIPPRVPSPSGEYKIRVENLKTSVTLDDIYELFSDVAPVVTATMPSIGAAVVVYHRKSDCIKAIETYNQRLLDAVPMIVKFESSGVSKIEPDISAIHKVLFKSTSSSTSQLFR